jgi:hypothetical protein
MQKVSCFFILHLLVFGSFVFAQDSIPDSTKVHSVRKAILFSAVIPGTGQIYNHIAMPKGQKKAFWKVPLIYAGLSASSYFLAQQNSVRKEYKQEYQSRLNGNSPILFTQYDNAGLLTLYTTARNQRDLLILGVGFVYLLNIVDAGIEAHFVDFDVSENISVHFNPTYSQNSGFGMAATFKFR